MRNNRDPLDILSAGPINNNSRDEESSTYPFTILHVEANFLRDFSCCGLTLPSLHDLLQHNEEEHTETQKSSHEIIPVMEIDDLQMYNNPSASAVDTTTREFHDIQDQVTPDSSIPPTPTDLDDLAKNIIQRIADDMWNNPFDYNYGAFDNHNHMLHLCIDEPTKSLCTILDSSQDGPNSKSGEQQVLPDTNTGLTSHDESKPWGCPVIGCEKAYKNLNGLKYHQSHGHKNQQLHDNGDGTFSIVNSETSAPYPGTVGMEKEKPFKCELCGKRYKTPSGLKYHTAAKNRCLGATTHNEVLL